MATITATATGNWSNTATWNGGAVPASGDDVTIPAGLTVTQESDAYFKTITNAGTWVFDSGTHTITIDDGGAIYNSSVMNQVNNNGSINWKASVGATFVDFNIQAGAWSPSAVGTNRWEHFNWIANAGKQPVGVHCFDEDCNFRCLANGYFAFYLTTHVSFAPAKTFGVGDGTTGCYLRFDGISNATASLGNEINFISNNVNLGSVQVYGGYDATLNAQWDYVNFEGMQYGFAVFAIDFQAGGIGTFTHLKATGCKYGFQFLADVGETMTIEDIEAQTCTIHGIYQVNATSSINFKRVSSHGNTQAGLFQQNAAVATNISQFKSYSNGYYGAYIYNTVSKPDHSAHASLFYENIRWGLLATRTNGGEFVNVTSADNGSPTTYGNYYSVLYGTNTLAIDNCIGRGSEFNIENINAGTYPDVSYSDMFGAGSKDYQNMPVMTGTDGNISADPDFQDSDADNYDINSGSPCVNTGTPTNSAPTDFDGNLWLNANPEMGCYTQGLPPPDPPANFVTISGVDGIVLGWTAPTSTYTAVKIQKDVGGYPADTGAGTAVYDGTGTGLSDYGLYFGTTWFYKAWSYSAAGYGTGQEASTSPQAVSPITEFKVVSGVDRADLAWTYPSPPYSFLQIQKDDGGYPADTGAGTQVYKGLLSSTFPDVGLYFGTTWSYSAWVYSTYSSSSVVQVATSPQRQPNVTTFTVAEGIESLSLSWGNPSGTWDFIQVQRDATGYPADTGAGTQVLKGTGASLVNSGLDVGTTYYYSAWTYSTYSASVGASDSGVPLPMPPPITLPSRNFRVQLKDNNGVQIGYIENIITGLSWEWGRIGGCGKCRIKLDAKFDGQIAGSFSEDYEVNIYAPNVYGTNILWYSGYVDKVTPKATDKKEGLDVFCLGYVNQLKRVVVRDKTYTGNELSDTAKDIIETFAEPITKITSAADDYEETDFSADSLYFDESAYDVITKLADTAGKREWGVRADKSFFFKRREDNQRFRFNLSEDFSSFSKQRDYNGMITRIYLLGGEGYNSRFSVTNRITTREEIISNGSITTQSVGQQYARMFLKENGVPSHSYNGVINSNNLQIEETVPLGTASISVHTGLNHKYDVATQLYDSGLKYDGGNERLQVVSIKYDMTDDGIRTTLNLGRPPADILDQFGRLKYMIDNERTKNE